MFVKQMGNCVAKTNKKTGPDQFLLSMEGPELVSPLQTHMGNCEYVFNLTVALSGSYSVRLLRLRSNYKAETTEKQYQPPYFDLLIDKTELRLIGTNKTNEKWIYDENYQISNGPLPNYVAVETRNFLPTRVVCPLRVRRDPSFRAGGSGRVWKLNPSKYYFQIPAEPPTLNQKILFVGDSHMRVLFNAFLYYNCNTHMQALKGFETSQCFKSPGLCTQSMFCMQHVPAFDIPEMSTTKFDAVLINVGHHLITGNIFMSSEKYTETLKKWKIHFSPYKTTWVSTFPQPIVRDLPLKQHNDMRTNVRIMELNTIAKHQFSRYLDLFTITMPMIEAAAGDCGHYLPYNIQQALSTTLTHYIKT